MSRRVNGAPLSSGAVKFASGAVHTASSAVRRPSGPCGERRAERGLTPGKGESLSGIARLPALDGLRALAVAAVLLYHLPVGWLPGGFLGWTSSSSSPATSSRASSPPRSSGQAGSTWVHSGDDGLGGCCPPAVHAGHRGDISTVIARDALSLLAADLPAVLGYFTNCGSSSTTSATSSPSAGPPLVLPLWSLAIEEAVLPGVASDRPPGRGPRGRTRRLGWVAHGRRHCSSVWMALLFPERPGPFPGLFRDDTHAGGLPGRRPGHRPPAVEPDGGGEGFGRLCWASGTGRASSGLVTLMATLNQFGTFTYRGGNPTGHRPERRRHLVVTHPPSGPDPAKHRCCSG